ncbi:MAG: beta-lactamase family protein [Propionibacteriaceae bacterium]|nr:beta-lactamase family protein [Propionibacteriaceae bacterium]
MATESHHTSNTSTASNTSNTSAATTERPRISRPRVTWLTLAACALVGALVALLAGPNPRLGDRAEGDPTLIADVGAMTGEGRGFSSLAVARVTGDDFTFAGFGYAVDGSVPGPDTPYELGSITKAFTGHLLADGVERGELALDDTLATHLPELEGTAAGSVTLVQLSTHTSGLPRLPDGMGQFGSALAPVDPYRDWTPEDVTEAARTAALDGAGEREYSNFGVALLGIAQARAAGVPTWSELAEQRLFAPLGLTDTDIIGRDDAEPAGLATSRWANGRIAQPWTGEGFAPTGSSTRTTARDLARFAQAVLDETAPGMAAVQPILDGEEQSYGLAWVIDHAPDGDLTWHTGGTGGTRTILALDADGGRAALSLAATDDASGGMIGYQLARGASDRVSTSVGLLGLIGAGVAAFVLLGAAFGLTRPASRISLGATLIDAALGIALAVLLGPWHWLPGWVLGAVIGALTGVIVLAILRAVGAPTLPERRRGSAIASLVFSALLAAVMGYLLF